MVQHVWRQGAARVRLWWTRTALGRRTSLVGVAALVALPPAGPRLGPFDILLFPTAAAPQAEGRGRLVFADSPFGVAYTADGHAEYNIQITAAKLPAPSSLGKYSVYQAWAVSPDLAQWTLMGLVSNGTRTVGSVDLNKFVVVVLAARDSASTSHDGTAVLHGTSPSGWLQMMFTEPEFHGVNQ